MRNDCILDFLRTSDETARDSDDVYKSKRRAVCWSGVVSWVTRASVMVGTDVDHPSEMEKLLPLCFLHV